MSQQDLLRARQLIQSKRFDEARTLLLQIDHPTADQWLDKLDEVSPPVKYKPIDTPRSHGRFTPNIRFFIIILLCLLIFLVLQPSYISPAIMYALFVVGLLITILVFKS